jgi:uncharacterized protein with ParB-like and HNH nuclease domain
MKENTIATKTVIKLIVNEDTPDRKPKVEKYIIPYYQRGYRWETRHVEYLLSDIDGFMNDERITDSSYCLQPVVVAHATDNEGKSAWEIIDGQQRLITLYLIFKYTKKTNYQLYFQNRVKSNLFIEKISEESYNHESPDFHYMSVAYDVIKEFFDKKTVEKPSYIDKFYVAMERVKVIWYELGTDNDSEKIDVFNRLNIGKIPLTDSELIRALLLSKITNPDNERESMLRQTEISEEWNRIEHELRHEEFWYFLSNEKNNATHIELIFNLIAGKEAESYSTYFWFEKEINKNDFERKNAETLWDKVKQVFGQLKAWYNNRTVYHYIGYLSIINHKKYSINELLNIQSNFQCKTDFCQWLKNEICEGIKGVNLKTLSYEDDSHQIQNILLLFNILSLENLSNIPQNRFPFHRYKDVNRNGGWSIEHIHAQNSEELKDLKQIEKWLDDTLNVLRHIKTVEKEDIDSETGEKRNEPVTIAKYVKKIEILKSEIGKSEEEKIRVKFNDLKNELSMIFDSRSVHELSNLTLLGKKDNSSLQNFLFPVKRNKIMELEKENHFIPYCTKNVFLKAYSNTDMQPYYWSETDKESYFEEINNIINSFKNN